MIIKNIESKIKLATYLSLGSFITAVIICIGVSFFAYKQVSNARKSIYILDNNIPILAKQTNMQMNRPAEYRAAVDLSSSVLTLQTDSIALEPSNKFTFYGKQKIERRSATITRSLITEGYLMDIPRSENNSHGVLITNWKTLENKDLSHVSKNTF